MVSGKQGQSGAAILVALLAALIILYVLFLPPEERAALLGENPDGTPGGPAANNILFSTPVGVVYPKLDPADVHDLPTVHIRTVDSAMVLAQRDRIDVSGNAFEKNFEMLTFNVDPMLTRNAVLAANLEARQGGNVIVSVNGVEVFDQPGSSRALPPVTLTNLQASNELRFETSSVGFAFWRTNGYTLTDVKVVADVTDITGARSTVRFTLTQEEMAYMERAKLSFVPVCNDDGTLSIYLSGSELFNGVPDCGVQNTLDLPPERLQVGENTLTFATSGDVLVDQGRVTTEGERKENRLFRFNFAPPAQPRPVLLRIMFADVAPKTGTIIVNGNTIPFRAQDIFAVPITPYIKVGENVITFEATGEDFEVVKFDVLFS